MNRDDIIRMAYDAGMTWEEGFTRVVGCVTETELERFAALVVAAEREICAKVCASMDWNGRSDESIFKGEAADECAAAIRARNNDA